MLIIGCDFNTKKDNDLPDNETKGEIQINFIEMVNSKNLLPDIDMTILSYDIIGSGHEEAVVHTNETTFGTFDFYNINSFDGNIGLDIARSMVIDSDGDLYVCGQGKNLVSAGSSDDWWIKKFYTD